MGKGTGLGDCRHSRAWSLTGPAALIRGKENAPHFNTNQTCLLLMIITLALTLA